MNAAKSAIDFDEYRVNFSNSTQFIERLQNVDENWYDVIAVVRGGGSGIEKLDDLSVLEAIVGGKTGAACPPRPRPLDHGRRNKTDPQ